MPKVKSSSKTLEKVVFEFNQEVPNAYVGQIHKVTLPIFTMQTDLK